MEPSNAALSYFGSPAKASTVLDELDMILNNLPAFTASGRSANAMTSDARLPSTLLSTIPQAQNVPLTVPDWVSYTGAPSDVKAGDIRAARQKAMISELLDRVGSLDLPPHSPSMPATPQVTPATVPNSSILTKISTLIDLLTYSGDTNSTEKSELAKRRGPELTNKPEYEKLLQQALQQLQSGGGKP